MTKIPPELREELSNDPFYLKCCIPSVACNGRVEWHHNLIYAGKQVNEKFCILPVCHFHHEREKDKETGEKLDYIMLCRAENSTLRRFSKAIDYVSLKEKLETKYGK